ncbi:class II fructose-1,6-bisphosphate aldolase [Candidatus Woesearchaeota archaeon]|nr:class II fructose-1,6-bisphosphate aldolase [Candidatus Woesearchaeota archaeon]
MLVTMNSLLDKAYRNHYAVGAFNVNNMEILQSVILAAKKQKSPVIISTSEGAIKYAGLNTIASLVKIAAAETKLPIALHLDHGRSIRLIKKAISIGYTSVMIDGSHLFFNENIKLTKKVVSMACKKNVSVEGELGTIGGVEDLVNSRKIIYTEPEDAKLFVEKTGIDALAVAIGTSHGAYKFAGKAKLDIDRLIKINRFLKKPLVLHGASQVPSWLVNQAKKYGAKLGSTEGVPDVQIRKAIENGIAKINTDTDLRLAFSAGLRKFLKENPEDFDPRHILSSARDLMQLVVENRIKLFRSVNKA